MKYNVFDSKNDFVGIVDAETEKQAVDKAQATFSDAVRVEEQGENSRHIPGE